MSHRPLGVAGGSRRVDHGSRSCLVSVDLGIGPDELFLGDLSFEGLATEDHHLSNRRNLRTDSCEQRSELDIGEHQHRVGVGDHVDRFGIGQPIVQRHRDRARLTRCVGEGEDLDRVLTEPHHLRPGLDAGVDDAVGESIRTGVELGEGHLPRHLPRSIVDHGDLVGRGVSMSGEQIHGSPSEHGRHELHVTTVTASRSLPHRPIRCQLSFLDDFVRELQSPPHTLSDQVEHRVEPSKSDHRLTFFHPRPTDSAIVLVACHASAYMKLSATPSVGNPSSGCRSFLGRNPSDQPTPMKGSTACNLRD